MRIHRIFPDTVREASMFRRKLEKARAARARTLWLAYAERGLLADGDWEGAVILEQPWHLREEVSTEALGGARLVLVADGTETDLAALRDFPIACDLLVRPSARASLAGSLAKLPSGSEEKIFFEFLPWSARSPERFTVGEIRALMRAVERARPALRFRPYPGLEVWDDRIDAGIELEPAGEERISRRDFTVPPKISVVIPTYNNASFLSSVLHNLLAQDYPRESFELIIVDDGSTDSTEDVVREALAGAGAVNCTLVRSPRAHARRAGDNAYRAGIARNLGARMARGAWLLFLDSDMVAHPGLLRALQAAQERADVVQCERHHIRHELCGKRVRYGDVRVGTDTYIREAGYWGRFFATDDWPSLEAHWKYTATYCLMLRREDFFTAGRFKRTFTTYGFEDVDLGFELARRGKKFHLLHEKVLHLTPPPARSEFGNSAWTRHRLLGRTAKTFFRQQLDPQIYDLLGTFMHEFPWWHRCRARLSGGSHA